MILVCTEQRMGHLEGRAFGLCVMGYVGPEDCRCVVRGAVCLHHGLGGWLSRESVLS